MEEYTVEVRHTIQIPVTIKPLITFMLEEKCLITLFYQHHFTSVIIVLLQGNNLP